MRATAAWDGDGAPPAIPSRKIDLHSLSSSDVADEYKTNAESSSGHGRGAVRSIVWAPGSNMVMVNSGKTKELHLITLSADGGIEGAALTKTIAGAESRYMVFVDNHDVRANTRAMDAKIATAKATMESLAGPAGPAGPSGAAGTNGLAGTAGAAGKAAPAALADMGASSQEVSDSSSDEAKTMAAAGLVLGALGFLFGAASLGVTLMRGGSRKSVAREVSFGKDKGGITEAKA